MGTFLLTPLAISLVILTGFLPLRFPIGAADDVSRALGVTRREIWLSSQEVSQLASTAGVSEQVVREVAPQVNQLSIWRRSVQVAIRINEETKGTTREVAFGVACDAFQGEINGPEELVDSLAQQVYGLTQPEFQQLVSDTYELYLVLENAPYGSDRRVAASMFCYALERLG